MHPAVARATSPAPRDAAKPAVTPARSNPQPSADAAARDRPLWPFAAVDVAIEDVVEDNAAGIEAGSGTEQPIERMPIAHACDGISREHVGKRRNDVRRPEEFEIRTVAAHERTKILGQADVRRNR